MAPAKLVSHRQLELIVEFAERHRDIVLGIRNGPLATEHANEAWFELAKNLNCIGEGIAKSPDRWKRYWHLLKCRTKAKAANIRRCRAGLGGAPNKLAPLTNLEKRIVNTISKDLKQSDEHIESPKICDSEADDSTQVLTTGITNQQEESASCIVKEENTESTEPGEVHYIENWNANTQAEQSEEPQEPLRPAVHIKSAREYDSHQRPTVPEEALSNDDPLHDTSARQFSSRYRSTVPEELPSNGDPLHDNRDENVPRWIYDLEERRVKAEERMADAVAALSTNNKSILRCLQHMAVSQAQLVGLLQRHLNPPR